MPTAVSYPGVYIEEIPSGVHTITGVATSITAFVGTAKRGPINKAIRCLGFADFERRFGGLNTDSELSYALRQFVHKEITFVCISLSEFVNIFTDFFIGNFLRVN